MSSPNILLIQTHQHRFDCLAGHGHAQLKTPTFDRLQREGVDFTRAYTPSALTSASRASLLSGRWPTQLPSGSARGLEPFRATLEGVVPVSRMLKDHGYVTGWVGNFYNETIDDPATLGFDDFVNDDSYLAWRRGQKLPPLPEMKGWGGEIDRLIKPEQSRLAWSVDRLLTLVGRYQESERPFFLRWDPGEPCPPNLVPFPYGGQYLPETTEPWPNAADTLAGKPEIQVQHRKVWGLTDWTWKDNWSKIVALYLGQVAHFDSQLGRLLAALESRGLLEQTVVLYTSDHGALIGSHGLADTPFMAYDEVLHVPLIVRWPGSELKPGTTCDSWSYGALDIAATILDAAGIDLPPSFEGQSLRDLATDSGERREDMFVAWPRGPVGNFAQRVVFDAAWKYVWNSGTGDELYDRVADPHELVNRRDDPLAADALKAMQNRLIAWMEELKDPLFDHWTRTRIFSGMKA